MLLVELQQHLLCPLVVAACNDVPHILEERVELDKSKIKTRQNNETL